VTLVTKTLHLPNTVHHIVVKKQQYGLLHSFHADSAIHAIHRQHVQPEEIFGVTTDGLSGPEYLNFPGMRWRQTWPLLSIKGVSPVQPEKSPAIFASIRSGSATFPK